MGKKFIFVILIFGLLLSGCAGKAGSTASNDEGAPASSSGSSTSANLSGALNLVLGSSEKPGVFDSYHIELTLDTPQLNDDSTAVVNETTVISADVQGKDVHILQTDPGTTTLKEGFIIGDKEYKMVDGKPQEMMGQIALGWAMWPLQVIMPYAYVANFARQTGADTLDGRAVDIYTFDSANADTASNSMMDSFGLSGMTTGKGTVWIDKVTGAMLKLEMSYTSDFKDNDQKLIGSGTGTIALQITNVNKVTVSSPIQ
jgi:hypothetical protein